MNLPLLLAAASPLLAQSPDEGKYTENPAVITKGHATDVPNRDNRTHRVGRVWLTVNNWGWMGNNQQGDSGAYLDPETQEWAPQCEVPGGSDIQYLYTAGLWLGALVQQDGTPTRARVSVGDDNFFFGGFSRQHEFNPGERPEDLIEERSTRLNYFNSLGQPVSHPGAISEQDFVAVYNDTLVDPQLTPPINGETHEPLGIEITQSSYAWSYNYARDLVIINYDVRNIGSKFLRNLYVGQFVDGDVGSRFDNSRYLDDITGFLTTAYDSVLDQDILINTAWIADNDGRDADDSGSTLSCPHVTGFRVLRSPNPKLRTSFNWWTSAINLEQDFGPSWSRWQETEDGNWTTQRGTPLVDAEKYFILSNGEFDYDQIRVADAGWITANPQQVIDNAGNVLAEEPWQDPSGSVDDVANGYDARYLISWGPMGVFDHVDHQGRSIFRLNPGESFSFTVALVAGENFHNRNRPQTGTGALDPELFDFRSLENAALSAARIYDNEMIDTPVFDFGEDHIPGNDDLDGSEGDGIPDTGDGWYGEDVGSDGLYAELPEGVDSVQVWYFGQFMGWYKGPDEDGSENNGRLDPGEDDLLWSLADFASDSGYVYAGPRFSRGGSGRAYDGQGGSIPFSYGTGRPDWFIGHLPQNDLLDRGDGIPDFQGPPPPPVPNLRIETTESSVILRWQDNAEGYRDPFSRLLDFEGYRLWVSNDNAENGFSLLAEYDKVDHAYFDAEGNMRSAPQPGGVPEAELDSTLARWTLQPIAANNGLQGIVDPKGGREPFEDLNGDQLWNAPEPWQDRNGNGERDADEAWEDRNGDGLWNAGEPYTDSNGNGRFDRDPDFTTYAYEITNAPALYPRWYSVSAFDYGDFKTGTAPLESSRVTNAQRAAPSGQPGLPVRAVPNPYRFDQDYTIPFNRDRSGESLAWENRDDGTLRFYPEDDRRLAFINLPRQALIRIYTLSGDLVQILPHNLPGDTTTGWNPDYAEFWDLNNRNYLQVASGLYYFSVEDHTPEGKGSIQTGKFVILK